MKYKKQIKKKIVHSFCIIPINIKGCWYWLKSIYILKEYKRIYYTFKDPNDIWYSESWLNIRICSKLEYLNYKKNSILPKSETEYEMTRR